MSSAVSGDMSNKEVRTGQVLNGVAMVGGANAMRMAVKEFRHTRALTPAAASAKLAGNRVVSRLSRVKGVRRLVSNPKATALGLGGGMLALHGAELVGDAISARSLHHQAKKFKEPSMPSVGGVAKGQIADSIKDYKSRRSSTKIGVPNVWRDTRIPHALPSREAVLWTPVVSRRSAARLALKGRPRAVAALASVPVAAGAAAGGIALNRHYRRSSEQGISKMYVSPVPQSSGYGVNLAKADASWKNISHYQDQRAQARRGRRIGLSVAAGGAAVAQTAHAIGNGTPDNIFNATRDYKFYRKHTGSLTSAKYALQKRPLTKLGLAGAAAGVGGAGMIAYGHAKNRNAEKQIQALRRQRGGVSKAYRRFDPEADRQRRLGAYSGIGIGTGVGLGMAAKHSLSRNYPNAGKVIANAVKSKKFRKPAALGAAALGSAGLGVAAYRRGISERNQPWN